MGHGWESASFEMNTRPNRVERDISRRDLALPSGFGLRLLAESLGCGLLVALGFFWGPLTVVALAMDGNAPWFWPTIGAVSIIVALIMFAYVRRDVRDFIGSLDES